MTIFIDFFSFYTSEQLEKLTILFKQQSFDFFKKDIILKTTIYPFVQETF